MIFGRILSIFQLEPSEKVFDARFGFRLKMRADGSFDIGSRRRMSVVSMRLLRLDSNVRLSAQV